MYFSFWQTQCMMAASTVGFGKIEARAVMKFLFMQRKGAVEIHNEMKEVLNNSCQFHSETLGVKVLDWSFRVHGTPVRTANILQPQMTKSTSWFSRIAGFQLIL